LFTSTSIRPNASVAVRVSRLFDLADLILAIGRQIRSSSDRSADMCTPVESAVMRFIDRNPGTSARAASKATLLPSSNFSRVLRGLEEKGLVRRDVDAHDARSVRLYPTARARENLQNLRDTWSRALEGIVDDPGTIDSVNATLRRIENELIARRQREGRLRTMGG
jgi:MarR family transcriptional regulator, temperature-dependent positive regulator of motility